MELCALKDLKSLLTRHGFRFSKSMGQNFLIDPSVPEEIALAAGCAPECGALEIGPGVGPLTVHLARRCGKVVGVELDRSLRPILEETLAGFRNVELVYGDVMKLSLHALTEEKLAGLTPIACANLPYGITTPAITALLESGCFSRITVMIQREVALRICAAPGTADYGAFSIFCQYHAWCERLFDVGPDCFYPAPKVTSSVVRLTPRPKPEEVEDEVFFFKLVRAAFAQRRKTLLNALSAAFGPSLSRQAIRDAMEACALPDAVRGERLGIPEFAALAKKIAVDEV